MYQDLKEQLAQADRETAAVRRALEGAQTELRREKDAREKVIPYQQGLANGLKACPH